MRSISQFCCRWFDIAFVLNLIVARTDVTDHGIHVLTPYCRPPFYPTSRNDHRTNWILSNPFLISSLSYLPNYPALLLYYALVLSSQLSMNSSDKRGCSIRAWESPAASSFFLFSLFRFGFRRYSEKFWFWWYVELCCYFSFGSCFCFCDPQVASYYTCKLHQIMIFWGILHVQVEQ